MNVKVGSAQTAEVREWMQKMAAVPRLVTAPWAKEVLDAFETAGITRAEHVSEESLGKATAAMGKTIDGLLGNMRGKCPVGMKLPSLGTGT